MVSEQPTTEQPTTEQLAADVVAYLTSAEGRESMARAAKESKELADKFRKMREVPWEKFHAPFTI